MAEEPLPAGGSCLLGSINLSAFVDGNQFNFDDFKQTIHIAVNALNDVLIEGLSLHPLDIQKQSVGDWRQIGLGVMGIADMLIKLEMKYDSQDAINFCDNIGHFLASEAIAASIERAKQYGVYPRYDKDSILKSQFINKHINDETRSMLEQYGLFNSQLLTIAPTGSLSTMLQISGGIEPIFANYYTRTTKSLHGHDEVYKVYTKIAKDWLDAHPGKDLPDYFVESETIDPIMRVHMQAIWQNHIDASISSTVNLPENTTVETVEDIYREAWSCGLKGITIFRSGCKRTAILSTTESNKNDIVLNTATKRPKELAAEYFHVKIKGEKFVIIIGLLNNKPYELFALPNDKFNYTSTNHKGIIIKNKKRSYTYKSDLCNIENIAYEGDDEKDFVTISLMVSQLLRHGVAIEHIVHTLKKTNAYMGSFVSAVIRVLSKYDTSKHEDVCPECGKSLIHSGGCVSCECGWSKCNFAFIPKKRKIHNRLYTKLLKKLNKQ